MHLFSPALGHFRLRNVLWAGLFVCLAVLLVPCAQAEPSEPAPLASKSLLLDAANTGSSLIAVGERGHVLRSADGGQIWQQIITPTRALLTAVTFADATHGWAVGQDATILATTDGGTSWTQQFHTHQLPDDDTARDAPLLDISCADANTCAASGAYGLFLITHDGGANWQRVYVKEDDRNFYSVHMFSPQHIVLAGEAGAFMESQSGGTDWSAGVMPYEGSLFGFLVLPDGSWLVHGLRGHVLRSGDAGANWQDIPTGVDTGLMGGRVLANGSVVLVGAGGVVLNSTDSCQSFSLHRQSARTALSAVIEGGNGKLLLLGEKGIQPIESAP